MKKRTSYINNKKRKPYNDIYIEDKQYIMIL